MDRRWLTFFSIVLVNVLQLREAACQFFGRSDSALGGLQPSCPINKAMDKFDMGKFLGDWYVQEYQYASEIKLRGLSCVGFKFTLNGLGDIVSNFTFRFPPRTGHFYHVATFSSFNEANPAIWDTKFAGVDLLTSVLDTDYTNWAVLAQCNLPSGGSPSDAKLFSYRIMSRSKSLDESDLQRIKRAMEESQLTAFFRYKIDQDFCEDDA